MTALQSFFAITFVFLIGFLLPIFFGRRAAAFYTSLFLALAGSLLSLLVAIWFFWLQKEKYLAFSIFKSSWLEVLPALQGEIRVDHLSAFFVLLIAAFSVSVALYSFASLQAPHFRAQRHQIASAFNLFVWSTMMVVVVNDVFSLIIVLEIMTLAFGQLALYKHNLYLSHAHNLDFYDASERDEKRKNARRAPQVYLMVSHASTAFLVTALLVLTIHAGSLSFDKLRATAGSLNSPLATVVFLMALAGLGIRAGLIPVHFWAPLVHPSSPTTTHALSLGIAIKVAIYLMFRFFFQFLTPQAWWGYLVLLIAVTTALINAWYAIASQDLKTALAYHSIENMGIITAGIGVALIYANVPLLSGQTSIAPGITTLALIASLYHLLNHAVFKGLLYLCTGAIDKLTNQVVKLEKLGGLIKIFPWTAATFLIGAISISGFPPFNGFVSEWLTLQSLLKVLGTVKSGSIAPELSALPVVSSIPFWNVVMVIFSLGILVAAFALTAFCFVKMAGLALLGAPRSSEEVRATWSKRDVPRLMRYPMAAMAFFCLALGLFPYPIVNWLSCVVEAVLGFRVALDISPLAGLQLNLPIPAALEKIAANFMIPLVVLIAVILVFLVKLFKSSKKQKLQPAMPWNCGTPFAPDSMQHTGASLSFLIRDSVASQPAPVFDKHEAQDYLPAHFNLSKSAYPQIVVEIFRLSYNRLINRLVSYSDRIGNIVQNGDIRRYLLYILIVNIVVLLLFLVR